MTKIKKIVAIALAFLMIFSSASVLANAWTVTVDDGFNLAIGTKFFINNGTEWVETVKAAPGDNVKARVYIDTDYYSNSSTLLFFYDKEFFTHSYAAGQNELSVNPELTDFSGLLNPAPVLNSQVNAGYIDSAFLDKYAAISVNLFMPSDATNAMYDGDTWYFEFDFVVAGSGTGDIFVKDTTVQNSTSQNKALVNVPKGPEGGTSADVWPMWRWNANVTLTSQPISTSGSVTFNANDGAFANGEAKTVINGDIKDEVVVPAAPERAGYTFIGWVDATDTTPTYEEAQATVPVANIPYEPVAYNAYWIKNVNITFNTNGGSEIAALENVTPYTEFAAVEAPTKDGYTFVGWDVRGNMELPETYPDVNTEYTAIWAKNVVVSFDTNGADPIESIPGVAGDEFKAEIKDPSKEGNWFVKWSPALPTVFPEDSTTYKAIFETRAFPVFYYVDNMFVGNISVEYGEEIPTVIGTALAPEGMAISTWYTDPEMTQEFVAGTTMATDSISLYAKYEYDTFNAIFDANGGKFADGTAEIIVPTVYMESIKVPAEEPTRAGYEFAGWAPLADRVFDEPNDMTFYATWNEVERNVEYYAEGYGENGLYETFDVLTGAELDVPANPYREGYDFIGWATEPNGAIVELPAVMPELEDGAVLKYYAVFEVERFSVTWRINGKDTVEYLDFGTAITAPEATKENYHFIGWALELDGEIVDIAETMPAEHLVYYAVFEIDTYTVTWVIDGEETSETLAYGAEITAPEASKANHSFLGWSLTEDGEIVEVATTVPAENLKYYAVFKIDEYTVTWVIDGAETVDTIAYGAAITAPEASKANHSFLGWSLTEDGEIVDVAETMGAENLKYYAVFKIDEYTVTWVIDGAETVDTIAYGAPITAPEVNVEGFNFLGWALEADSNEIVEVAETMGAENLKYYAVLEEIILDYTVTWVIDGVETVETLTVGDAIVAPEATKAGFVFKYWSLEENGAEAEVPATMGAENLMFYAVFRDKIKLVPKSGSTGVVERDGVIESYNAGYTVTDDWYAKPANWDTYYVYGLTGRRINAASINSHFTVNDTENGYFVLENSVISGTFGTGAKVKVYDNANPEEPVEEFWVIIFGDVDGNGVINVNDTNAIISETVTATWSNRRKPVKYRVKSANFDGNTVINVNDVNLIRIAISSPTKLDQTTGIVS